MDDAHDPRMAGDRPQRPAAMVPRTGQRGRSVDRRGGIDWIKLIGWTVAIGASLAAWYFALRWIF